MGKGSISITFFTLLAATQASGWKTETGPDAEAKALFRSIRRGNEKLSTIRLYLQEIQSGPNATLYEVARASITAASPTAFGQVRVTNSLITAGPERNSTVQGLIASTDLENPALAMMTTFFFTSGKYSGSSICVPGRNQFMDRVRERPVIGGTGVFRFSRGYNVSSIIEFETTGPAHVTVDHMIYATYSDT